MSCKGLHTSILLADTTHPCHSEGHQVSASHSAKLSHPRRNAAATKAANQQRCLWCSSSVPSAPPLGLHHLFLKIKEMFLGASDSAQAGYGWARLQATILDLGKEEISSANGTGSAPLSSSGGFVFASAARLSPSFLCLLLPWMEGSEKEPRNVTLSDCCDAGTGRAESLVGDKPGATSACVGSAVSCPEPPQPGQHRQHRECDGEQRAGSSRGKHG